MNHKDTKTQSSRVMRAAHSIVSSFVWSLCLCAFVVQPCLGAGSEALTRDPATKVTRDYATAGLVYARYDITGLTGGGSTNLDGLTTAGLPTAGLPTGTTYDLYIGGEVSRYRLRAGTDAENSPAIIRPDDYHASTNARVWALIEIGGGGGGGGDMTKAAYDANDDGEIDDSAIPAEIARLASPTFTGNLGGTPTITGNWVNTANPWADNEVSDTLTIGASGSVHDSAIPAVVTRDSELATIATSGSASDLSTGTVPDARIDPSVTRDSEFNDQNEQDTLGMVTKTGAQAVTGAKTVTDIRDLIDTHGGTAVGTTETVSATSAGYHVMILDENLTQTLSGFPSGEWKKVTVEYVQDGSGGNTVSLAAGPTYRHAITGASISTIDVSTTASATSQATFASRDGGTTIYVYPPATSIVLGPSSATDNAVVRFDATTGKLVQNSVVTIADTSGDIAINSNAGAQITGSANGNLTIRSAPSGASRTMILQTTTSGGTPTTALTLGADQSATFAGTVAVGDDKFVGNSSTQTGFLIKSYSPSVTFRINASNYFEVTTTFGRFSLGGVTSYLVPVSGGWQFDVNSATPAAIVLGGTGSRSGTDTNVAGANLTLRSGIGTGNSTGSSLIFQTPTTTTSGTGAQTSTTRLTINETAATLDVPLAGAKVRRSASLATDDTYTGADLSGVNAGATIAQWEAVYLDASATEWLLADANGSGTYPARGLAVAAGTDGGALIVIEEGVVRNDAWNWTIGGTIYLSATAGGLTQDAGSFATGDKLQVVGYALTADVMRVKPSTDYGTVE